MYDIASQLVLKWARQGPDHSIIASHDFTRLTFDTLALCTMHYRFNSFYILDLHPFVDVMNIYMLESDRRAFRPDLITKLMCKTNAKYASSVKLMTDLAKFILQHRRENPTGKMDVLNAMVSGIDPLTKERMDDESIVQNLMTMLIAGETPLVLGAMLSLKHVLRGMKQQQAYYPLCSTTSFETQIYTSALSKKSMTLSATTASRLRTFQNSSTLQQSSERHSAFIPQRPSFRLVCIQVSETAKTKPLDAENIAWTRTFHWLLISPQS